MFSKTTVMFVCLVVGLTSAGRVVEQKLSDEEPGTQDYDHEAFAGEDEAKEFEKLAPEESQRRLGMIFDRIDTDNDGLVTGEELQDWITKTQHKYITENTRKEFENHDANQDGLLSWDEYYELNFGFLKDEDWKQAGDEQFSYKVMLKRDEKRFKSADQDKDGSCTMDEYQAFLHPEEFDHMKEIVLDETLVDMDKNGDGMLDITEYMNDLYRPENKSEKEPEWVGVEREQFIKYRDTDKDGKLSREEVRQWILPEDYNHANAEALHLVHASDSNHDDVLDKEEMLEHYDTFVGSQATEWGEMFNRHDEF